MKKIHLLSMFFMLLSANLLSQYSTDWIRPADNIAKTGCTIVRDSSDNVFVTGYIQSQNIYTRKYNKFGALQWEKISPSGIASNYEKPVWTSAGIRCWSSPVEMFFRNERINLTISIIE